MYFGTSYYCLVAYNVFAALPHILFLYYNDTHQKVSHDVYNDKNALRCFDYGFRYSKVLIGRRHFMNDIGCIKLMIHGSVLQSSSGQAGIDDCQIKSFLS